MSYGHTIYNEPFIYESNSVILDIFSIYWTVGIKVIIDAIHSGAIRIISRKSPLPTLQLHLIEKYQVNFLSAVPFKLIAYLKSEMIHKMDLSHVKRITSYGSKLPCQLVAQFKHHFPNAHLISLYGLTEIGAVSLCYLDADDEIAGERLVDGCIAKIVDSNENVCGPNMSGEIRIKKKYKFAGYFKDPIATEAAVDENDFFRTGDIGYFDENGILYIGDRMKNVINLFYFAGIMIPSEVEDVLIKMADIKEVCVVGIQITSGACLPAAVVVRQPNSHIDQHDVYTEVSGNTFCLCFLLFLHIFRIYRLMHSTNFLHRILS